MADPALPTCRYAANPPRDGWDCVVHGGFVPDAAFHLPTSRCSEADPRRSAAASRSGLRLAPAC